MGGIIARHCPRVIIFGVHSFVDSPVKVGIQHIAEGLSKNGWRVDYVSLFSSPLDAISLQRRNRWNRVWKRNQDIEGISIAPGLKEYAFKAYFPANKSVLRYDWQMAQMPRLAPSWLTKPNYLVCIHDISANICFLPQVRRRCTVLRLNDIPEGFGYQLSGKIISSQKAHICSGTYDEIWAAHYPLQNYAQTLSPNTSTITIPNGVGDSF